MLENSFIISGEAHFHINAPWISAVMDIGKNGKLSGVKGQCQQIGTTENFDHFSEFRSFKDFYEFSSFSKLYNDPW